jgi:hypothetical protein
MLPEGKNESTEPTLLNKGMFFGCWSLQWIISAKIKQSNKEVGTQNRRSHHETNFQSVKRMELNDNTLPAFPLRKSIHLKCHTA